MKLIKVKYLGLCNLLANSMIVPELLQYDCNTEELTKILIGLLTDNKQSQAMTTKLAQLKQSLSSEGADCSIGELVEEELLLEA